MQKNLFNSVKMFKPKTNRFDLSHDVKMSFNMGELVPTMVMECVPGDKYQLGCDALIRFQALIAPVMHRIDVYMHYFFVPNRIVWPHWENFITNTKTAGVLPAFPTLTLNADNYDDFRLMDYLGLPKPTAPNAEAVNALPFAAYQMVFDQYYRDQNLQTSSDYTFTPLVDGSNDAALAQLCALRRRAWEHDYFTAALPFAQKGESVAIPLGSIEYNASALDHNNPPVFRTGGGVPPDEPTNPLTQMDNAGSGKESIHTAGTTSDASDLGYDPAGTLQNEPVTINTLRLSTRIQEWLEKAARGGSRYFEWIRSMFGLLSPDSRLQRPEYITGTKAPVMISEVLQTSSTDVESPQGNMAGHGVSVTSGNYGYYRCQEHGYIIGICSVRPKTSYYQGIPKHFLKTLDPTQYFFSEFAHLGEQEVLNKELYVDHSDPDETFGYVPRYAEYKFMPNRLAGDMKDTLLFWNLARDFTADPNLNNEFIECLPSDRIFAVQDETIQKLIGQVVHKISAIRPMPVFGTPSF